MIKITCYISWYSPVIMCNSDIFCVPALCHVPFCWSLSKIASCSSQLSASTFLSHSLCLWPLKTSCDVCLVHLQKKKKRSTEWQWRGEGDGRIAIRFLLSFICLHAISSWVQYVSGAGKGHEKQTMTEGSYKKKTEKYRSTCRSKSPPFISFWLFFSILLFLSLL